ncbi:MAG: acetoacetate--CoA ligase [Pseudomonadota bacterium]
MSRPVLWSPDPDFSANSCMADFTRWAAQDQRRDFHDYNDLWRWSVEDLEDFWDAIARYSEFPFHTRGDVVLTERKMPGAEWFPNSTLNFADLLLRYAAERPDELAVVSVSETFGRQELTFAELHAQVSAVAAALVRMGVGQGDRVVAFLPNTPPALIGFLATVSLGAIWSLCAPDMGHVAVLDRFRQIEPKVLIAQDGYVHAGTKIDRRDVLGVIEAGLPTLTQTIRISVLGSKPESAVEWSDVASKTVPLISPVSVPFDHPLWVVYSSGTTGNPKPIVHGHGGVGLEMTKQQLHMNARAGDRFTWLTSSGWIMWNAQWCALSAGMAVVMYDGAPNHPDMGVVWRLMADERVTFFGAGAAFFEGCLKADVVPRDLDLSALIGLGSTGSPLSDHAYDWIYRNVKADLWLAPMSGGTDLAGAFVGGNPMMPVRRGEMQCRYLGNAVRAFDPKGQEVFGTVGELVCTEPLPSMPLFFWGDDDGSRLHDSYYDTYPGVWRHGDWIEINEDGGSVIYGRSDATINRKGLRLGSAEIYQAVEGLDFILDSLVVDLEFLGRDSFMPLFVVMKGDTPLDGPAREAINTAIREAVSARFIPSEIVEIAEVPRTMSGKKLEVPVKKLLLGGDPAAVVNRDSMANPAAFDIFITYAATRAAQT